MTSRLYDVMTIAESLRQPSRKSWKCWQNRMTIIRQVTENKPSPIYTAAVALRRQPVKKWEWIDRLLSFRERCNFRADWYCTFANVKFVNFQLDDHSSLLGHQILSNFSMTYHTVVFTVSHVGGPNILWALISH